MEKSVNAVIQAVYEEFSTLRVERFTIEELSDKSQIDKATIFAKIGTMEEVYKAVFKEMILKKVIKHSKTFEDLINNFVDYVSKNESFSLNMYFQSKTIIGCREAIELIDKLVIHYCGELKPSVRAYLIAGYINVIRIWYAELFYEVSDKATKEARTKLLMLHRNRYIIE